MSKTTDRKDYILHQFRRTWNKKSENYCIERIYNKIDNADLKFVTQQMFRRKENKIALADLYFPQLNLSVEIDEDHHKSQEELDKERTADILKKMRSLENVVEFEPEELRINAESSQTLESLNAQIDTVVELIKERINKLTKPLEWEDIIKTADQVKAEGKDIFDGKIALRTIQEVSELFDKGYYGMQRCYFEKSKGSNIWIWCPKLKLEDVIQRVPFNNEISLDGTTIYESSKENNSKFVEAVLQKPKADQKRIVFPYYKTESGEMAYVFKGIYVLDPEKTREMQKRVWVRETKCISLDLSK